MKKLLLNLPKTVIKLTSRPLFLDPDNFFGDTLVDYLIKFKDTYTKIIGKYHGQFGPWNTKALEKIKFIFWKIIMITPKYLMDKINVIAQKLFLIQSFITILVLLREYF